MLKQVSPLLVAVLLAVACNNSTPPPATPGGSANPTPAASAQPSASGGSTSQPSNQPSSQPTAAITGDQPSVVSGQVSYSNRFFTEGVAEPLIILEDQGGFVTRNRNFEITEKSQVIGQITSDFYISPFDYTLTLPSHPNGSMNDVDHDGQTDQGVQVFAVAYWTNTWGDPYLELRDQGGGGWSSAYASTRVSDAAASYLEVTGGKYVVWAPDATEQFPSGFGADNKLFTDDDPLMALEQGWSVIDMDQTPFAVSRDANPNIDLIEPASQALDDFSAQTYSQAFDSMLEKFRHEYAWTELKHIDWDAEAAQYRQAFVDAENAHDPHAYALALRDFLWSIPDTHVGFDQSLLNADFANDTAGGVGFSMTETDDGKFIVDYVTPGGPADTAGIKFGAEIFSIDGQSTADKVSATVPWSSPFSTEEDKRLQQVRYALRFPLAKGSVDIIFSGAGGQQQTASVAVANERDSFNHSSTFFGQPDFALPVEFAVLPTNPAIGYIQINSFFDNQVLTIQLWERAIKYLKDNGIGSVVLDMRHNGGGSGWLADQMAAYFFDHNVAVGNVARYDPTSDSFYTDPTDVDEMIPPPADLQYSGTVAVLVGPACASACEFFSYDMTLEERAFIVGQYATEGAGGSVEQFVMPEGIAVQMTIGRATDAQGNVHLEGKGVVPTLKVPVTLATIQQKANGQDPVLAAAEQVLGANP